MLLLVMNVGFQNTCTVSGTLNVIRVVPGLYGWLFEILRFSLIIS